MPRTRSLLVTFVIALVVAIAFAFTLIGLASEVVAILVLLALAFRGVRGVVRHGRTRHSL